MQMMRTSLRHFRISKLQKEKFKQNKMWDFTVRGWRVADIEGIEDLFQDDSAVESQKVVKDLKYDDMLIGKAVYMQCVLITPRCMVLGLGDRTLKYDLLLFG